MVMIICITGMRGCGKTMFGDVARSMALPVYEMRSIVAGMMVAEGIEISNRNIREYAKSIREQFGKDIVAKKMIELIRKENKPKDAIVIIGIRGMYEVRAFRESFGEKNVVLLAIHAPPRIRYRRLLKKDMLLENKDSYEDFLWSDEMELGFGVAKAIALADIMIINDGTLDEYKEKCKEVIGSILRGEVGI
ncbi:MAG: dephospho-CoA kinase [Candidatus Micrarchaeota archaeon]|nr:dephospho-CoA kinase [Candidatus Micrarchaeota archaeon]